MRDAVHDALVRYQAMAGQAIGIPEEDERAAARDRERFGQTYLAFGDDGVYLWHPLLMIRFMTEICGIPLRESRDAVIEFHRETRPPVSAPTMAADAQARELLATLGNIFEAREFASFAADALEDEDRMGQFWREVIECVETMAPGADETPELGDGIPF